MDFEQFSSKEIAQARRNAIEAKYANKAEVKNDLLSYEENYQQHLSEVEGRKENYKRRLDSIYSPLIEKLKSNIQNVEETIAINEEKLKKAQEALENGDKTQEGIIAGILKDLANQRKSVEQKKESIEKFEAGRNAVSEYEQQEKKYNSFTEIIGQLYESQLTQHSSEYFSNAVNSAKTFIQNLKMDITSDVELFEQIKNYCQVRERVEKYISKRTSVFGMFTTKGETRLSVMTSLRDLLDEHEEFLINRYNSLLETGGMKYIDSEDHFQMPGTIHDLNETKFAKRISFLDFHEEISDYMCNYRSMDQKFLDENGSKPGFVRNIGDNRFSQAFTPLRMNADGSFSGENDSEIADLYMDCFNEDLTKRKEALEKVIKTFSTHAIRNFKAVLNDLNIQVNGDSVSELHLTREEYMANYKKLFMVSNLCINMSSLLEVKKGNDVGNGKEWHKFAADILNEKELDPYWKELSYYVNVVQSSIVPEFQRLSAMFFVEPNNLTVSPRVKPIPEAMTEAMKEVFRSELPESYKAFTEMQKNENLEHQGIV